MMHRRARSAIVGVLLVAVGWAALFPMVAATLDHHAVERHPAHGHIFADGVPRDHLHGHEAGHSHVHGNAASPDGITFLPANNDTTGVSILQLVSTGLAVSLALLVPPLFTLAGAPWRNVFSGFTPPVDKPPPRPAFCF